jgi:tRNA(fMet)-specific endonuclease VapC
LRSLAHSLLARIEVLPWDSRVTGVYADLRASFAAAGIVGGPHDIMIAAHAVATGAVLVTRDKALARAPAPLVTDGWAEKPT